MIKQAERKTMAQGRTRMIKMYLLPDEMRLIRIAAARADTPLSSFVRNAVLKHIAASNESTIVLQKSLTTPIQAPQDPR
jgi:uncharacterized protein (DUF1778 family)